MKDKKYSIDCHLRISSLLKHLIVKEAKRTAETESAIIRKALLHYFDWKTKR